MWLVVTEAVCHSEATVRERHEQMGCSLFKVGGLPTGTDWMKEEREKKMAGDGPLIEVGKKNKSMN